MLFNSYEFILIFLPITFFTYFYLNYKRLTRASKGFLVFSSLFFYSWWNVLYLPIILSSILFNYIIGISFNQQNSKINHNKFSKKYLLIFGIASNIALLGYFKYTDFLIDNLSYWVFTDNIPNVNLALPLAISFFTFQQISYLVDSYNNEVQEYDFLNYSLFVTFFPQLIAGPIVHHREMMPQFDSIKSKIKNYRNISMGMFIFSIGLFKKVIIADTFSIWANSGFDNSGVLSFFEAWTTSLSYTFQLYFDFSGYTDMAIGAALLFNIKLPINFNSPYKATNIQNFWKRWHITLGRFLREYVYIPLGGNKKGEFRTYNNVLATFIIGGIWHGAGWTFVFWGFLHGMALVIYRLWSKLGFKLWGWVAWIITFNFLNITWVFFRAKEWGDAVKILEGMFGMSGINIPSSLIKYDFLSKYENITFRGIPPESIIILIIGFILISQKNTIELKIINNPLKLFIFGSSLVFSIPYMNEVSEFLYFNF